MSRHTASLLDTASLLVVVLLTLGIARAVHAQQAVNLTKVNGAAPPQAICDNPSAISTANIALTAATGRTQIVAISGSTVIYVCGYVLTAGGDDTTKLEYGTGSNCGTGTATLETITFDTNVGRGINTPNQGALQMKTAAGNAFCVNRTNSVTLNGILVYVQQ